jgi:hypothetical protein
VSPYNFQPDVHLFSKMLHPETTVAMLVLPFPLHGNREAWYRQFAFILDGRYSTTSVWFKRLISQIELPQL